ncbi:hypothetical protein TSUD_214350 [Trifolium subterraneum]|uniref:Uncharacterized protein n=1 Tax=Trifolium subterraneum TaxID=3900 RepID=A0A2Z6MUP2_TRISU|nr:hypothetical protein TSUD_214350 [Trifolium subterraneum]
MASDPSCCKCLDITQFFFDIDYLPARRLFKDNNRNILLRQHAVSVIAKVKEIVKKMIELCGRMSIEVAAEDIEAENRSLAKGDRKGNEAKNVEELQPQMERAISNIEPRKHMNFELNCEKLNVGGGRFEFAAALLAVLASLLPNNTL